MLKGVLCLESLSIKIRGSKFDEFDLTGVHLFLPQTLKLLKLQLVNEKGAIPFIKALSDLGRTCITLLRLSLVLNVISDELVIAIANSLPFLGDLDLEDKPRTLLPPDLTNTGLQSLGLSQHLTSLSIVRTSLNMPASFERVDDLGLMPILKNCRGLESVKLGGFSRVTDAGFSSILCSCHNLKKFEVHNAPLMSDLAFHDIVGVISLTELRIFLCNLITSEAVAKVVATKTLEVLVTCDCSNIANPCLDYISCLSTLTTLRLGRTDITDNGLAVLGKGDLPIARLSLRGCLRVTDRGIFFLLNGGEKIKKTLLSLDIGFMPEISDRGIETIISSAQAITELSMRYCTRVTNAALEMLASGISNSRIKMLRRLDLCHCNKFSTGLLELLQDSSFRGLRWLGVGSTSLVPRRDDYRVICTKRPWLILCLEGCEVGCRDGWHLHHSNGRLY